MLPMISVLFFPQLFITTNRMNKTIELYEEKISIWQRMNVLSLKVL